ncbi:tripartite tricarboxylate transporter TctB family protein [Natronolimnobius sp. AArcel1]|uniref:tripartite tricarboxylate transporter TctB family protein n=1 Tax=Natronolimnobius sp. AArcel1 TaxID=1679093 RepID=UPI0013EA69DE|nr:tripartite tricarboxylate transporter TctB family protein [Natronolimnobius sp. AArcel1]NGM71274.1 tripartite tricarboxylate transporter TctB family protein [Natronolimnobius sp. AArcel1]
MEREDTTTSPDNTQSESVSVSVPLSAVLRYLIPIAVLLLSANYVNETYGQIRAENLYYPYLIIGVMCVLSLVVIIEETIDLRSVQRDIGTHEALAEYVNQWRVSISLAILIVIYVVLIPVLGFFSASVILMTASMYATGVQRWRLATLVIIATLSLIWLMFIEVLGIQPPAGLIDGQIYDLLPTL